MSRSNPSSNEPNPAQRRFEWKGKDGHLQYYDKSKTENVIVKLPFTCILLDRTACVRGFNKKMSRGIFSNEVRDTRTDSLVVKIFDGGIVAEGLWSEIKDKVTSRSVGGVFAINCYVAFKDGDQFKIGAIQMSGCALGPWFEFEKEHRKMVDDPSNPKVKTQEMYARAIQIDQGELNSDGEIEFVPPVFSLTGIKPSTNEIAVEFDRQLQEYFKGYFSRNRTALPEPEEAAQHDSSEGSAQADAAEGVSEPETPEGDESGDPKWF
jgi:hypothetical protein